MPLHPPEPVHEVALLEFQDSKLALPEATAVGAAERLAEGAGISATVAVAAVLTPPGPVHMME
jgi:hypothetical protein